MKRNSVGKTNVRVTDISFGCASIGNLYQEASDQQVAEVLASAWDAGIRYFDTAPHYGRGLSETRLGNFLSERKRSDYVISTKVGRVLTPGATMAEADGFINPLPNAVRYDYSGDGIEASLEGSLERLQTNHAEIIFVHDLGTYTHGEANAAHMEDFFGSGYERLIKLKEEGRIGAFGLGVNENQICLDVMDHGTIDVILLAGRLTLLDRSGEAKLAKRCLVDGTSLVLGGVLNSGILATGAVEGATYDYQPAPPKILDRVRILERRAAEIGIPLATAALQFAKRQPLAASVLIGTASASILLRNVDALAAEMPAGFDAVFEMPFGD